MKEKKRKAGPHPPSCVRTKGSSGFLVTSTPLRRKYTVKDHFVLDYGRFYSGSIYHANRTDTV